MGVGVAGFGASPSPAVIGSDAVGERVENGDEVDLCEEFVAVDPSWIWLRVTSLGWLFVELDDSSGVGEFDECPAGYASASAAESDVGETGGAAADFVAACEVVGERASDA